MLDLENGYDYEDFHIGKWEEWSPAAFELLNNLGISCEPFSEDVARENLSIAINYCQKKSKERGFSEWRGLLMGADHYASALIDETQNKLEKAF